MSPMKCLHLFKTGGIHGDGGHKAISMIGGVHRKFRYDATWLKNPIAFALDPGLSLGDAAFFPHPVSGTEVQVDGHRMNPAA